MDPDTTYACYNGTYEMGIVPPSGESTFPGKRLVLIYSRTSIQFPGSSCINDLVLMNGAWMKMHNKQDFSLTGNIYLPDPDDLGTSEVFLRTGLGRRAYIDSSISGSGGMTLIGEKDGGSPSSCTFYLRGTNTAYSGKITVSNAENDPATNTTLRISDVRQLGGAMGTFTYNALSLSNWSRFRADATLDFNEPTRGVYFVGGNYVNVPTASDTLTLSTQTTLAGTLVKEGSGTLALGGTLKFTSGQSDTPIAGTNVLQVSAGRIKPASKAGADGLAISFAAGTGIKLAPVAETDPDVTRYGLYDVKWATPFDLTETDGKLDVALDLPEEKSEIPAMLSFGVCTVPSAAASALEGNIVLPSIKGYTLKLDSAANGDDTVTFTATYSKRGLTITIQ